MRISQPSLLQKDQTSSLTVLASVAIGPLALARVATDMCCFAAVVAVTLRLFTAAYSFQPEANTHDWSRQRPIKEKVVLVIIDM